MTTTTVDYASAEETFARYQIEQQEARSILGISESTQFRYRRTKAKLKATQRDRFLRFQRIVKQAQELFENEAETKRWLLTPKQDLEGKTPLQLLVTDEGTKKVEEMLYRAEYGIFS
jgi:putative toxin-antitoxin system antitoxin component (TIGR02293 family)